MSLYTESNILFNFINGNGYCKQKLFLYSMHWCQWIWLKTRFLLSDMTTFPYGQKNYRLIYYMFKRQVYKYLLTYLPTNYVFKVPLFCKCLSFIYSLQIKHTATGLYIEIFIMPWSTFNGEKTRGNLNRCSIEVKIFSILAQTGRFLGTAMKSVYIDSILYI